MTYNLGSRYKKVETRAHNDYSIKKLVRNKNYKFCYHPTVYNNATKKNNQISKGLIKLGKLVHID